MPTWQLYSLMIGQLRDDGYSQVSPHFNRPNKHFRRFFRFWKLSPDLVLSEAPYRRLSYLTSTLQPALVVSTSFLPYIFPPDSTASLPRLHRPILPPNFSPPQAADVVSSATVTPVDVSLPKHRLQDLLRKVSQLPRGVLSSTA